MVCSFASLVRFPEGIGMPPGLQGTASPRARIAGAVEGKPVLVARAAVS